MLFLLGCSAGVVLLLLALSRLKIGARPKFSWSSSKPKRRELGLLEQWYNASHDMQVMMNFCVAVQGVSDTPISKSDLEAAMKQVCELRPLLQMTIIGGDSQPEFAPVKKLDYDAQIRFEERKDAETWIRVIENENMHGFGNDIKPAPLWRLVLVAKEQGDFELILTIHHAVCDGRAAVHVAQEILNAYKRVKQNQEPSTPPAALALPMDAHFDCRPTVGYLLTRLVKHHFMSKASNLWLGANDNNGQRSGHFLVGELAQDKSQRLLERCREKGVTVQCYLLAAAKLAYFEMAQVPQLEVQCSTAFDNRALLNPRPPIEELATFASDISSSAVVTRESRLWDLARLPKAWTPANLDISYQTLGLLQFVKPLRKTLRELRDKQSCARTSSVCISNLGRIVGEERYANLTVKAIRHAQLKVGEGPVFNVCLLTLLPQNTLAYSCAYVVPNVTHEQAAKIGRA